MPTTESDAFAIANLFFELLYLPKTIYFCAVFAYDGFKHGVTLTHAGMRKGLTARLYGVFYLAASLLFLIRLPGVVKAILAIGLADIQESLSFGMPGYFTGLFMIGIALFIFVLREFGLRSRNIKKIGARKRIHRTQEARRFSNWMGALPLALGIQALIGLPYWVYVGIFGFFIYFAPFASPKEIKKLFRFQEDIDGSPQKSVSTPKSM